MTENLTTDEATVAAKWWADKLRGPNRMDGTGDGPRDSRYSFAEAMATALSASEASERDPSDVDKFEAAVAEFVKERLEATEYGVTLSVDYGPDWELMECAKRAGVRLNHMTSLPWKTVMWIKRGSVKVSEGYGASAVELLGAEAKAA